VERWIDQQGVPAFALAVIVLVAARNKLEFLNPA